MKSLRALRELRGREENAVVDLRAASVALGTCGPFRTEGVFCATKDTKNEI